jgi:pimeloyl-ACP methyl ester carboxylesterase
LKAGQSRLWIVVPLVGALVAVGSVGAMFAQAGVHVFTFDFSGHGRSPGSLDFDNAATDRLARQVLAAKGAFRLLSGLTDERMILLGHSMGARVALQAATIDPERIAGLILLGAQVNLATNVQSLVFTGVADAELAWVQSLGPGEPPTNILLIIGSWDDILTPANGRLLLKKLAEPAAVAGQPYGALAEGTGREMVILDGLLHNYEVFSPWLLAHVKGWSGAIWGPDVGLSAAVPTTARRNALWVSALLGLFLALVAGEQWAAAILPPIPTTARRIVITDVRRFLRAKLLLWLPALPLTTILATLFFFVPLGVPVFNLIYVGFIGGYGLLLLLLYRLGHVPGTRGRLPFSIVDTAHTDRRHRTLRILLAVGVEMVLLVFTAAYARTGWFYIPPTNVRLLWLILFTPVTALGFWIGLHEGEMLTLAAPDSIRPRIATTLIGLVPFFLWTLFLAAIGSLSGMVSGIQGLVILALVLAAGALLQRLAGRPWLAALSQSILLYWLILPQGVLFSR